MSNLDLVNIRELQQTLGQGDDVNQFAGETHLAVS